MPCSRFVGSSPSFRAVLEKIDAVANAGCAVLLWGETGTGKEVLAHAIHDRSSRRQNTFVALNCAAVPASLLESELFGHERGAYTGAITATVGRFQCADRGTLFLDEIGDLPLDLQPKLLRVLQEQQFERLGGGRTTQVDVRVIAATSRNLKQMVLDRQFRADLYYRLSVFPIELPPLRDRRDDIPALVEHFVAQFAERYHKPIPNLPETITLALQEYDWPGNIRELQNFVERAMVMNCGTALRSLTGEQNTRDCAGGSGRTLFDAERAHIRAALRETKWVVGGPMGAAAKLGLPRTTLMAKMRKLGIARSQGFLESEPPNREMTSSCW